MRTVKPILAQSDSSHSVAALIDLDTREVVAREAEAFELDLREESPLLTRILCTAIALAACLIPIRATTAGVALDALRRPFEEIPKILILSCYDLAYVALITCTFVLALKVCGTRKLAQRIIYSLYLFAALISLLVALMNVEIVRRWGVPLQLTLLEEDLRAMITNETAWKAATLATWMCLAMVALAMGLQWIARRARRLIAPRTAACLLLPVLCFHLLFSHWYLMTQQASARHTANPVVAMLGDLVRHDAQLANSLPQTTWQVATPQRLTSPQPDQPVFAPVSGWALQSMILHSHGRSVQQSAEPTRLEVSWRWSNLFEDLAGHQDSTENPASDQPRQPPSIDFTLRYPIFWRLSAASAERNPPPQ